MNKVQQSYLGHAIVMFTLTGLNNFILLPRGRQWSGRGLAVRALDPGPWTLGFDPHTGHGSLLKLRS